MGWLQMTVSRGLPLSHPALNKLSILITSTKCSRGGLGLPLNFFEMAPLAHLTTQLSCANTLTNLYLKHNMGDHGLIFLIRQLLKEPVSDFDLHAVERYQAKNNLLSACQHLKGLHSSTTLEDMSNIRELTQEYASTALAKKKFEIIMDSLHYLGNMGNKAPPILIAMSGRGGLFIINHSNIS